MKDSKKEVTKSAFWKRQGNAETPIFVYLRSLSDEEKRNNYFNFTGKNFSPKEKFANVGAYTGSLIFALSKEFEKNSLYKFSG
jgi:hypothetical protein